MEFRGITWIFSDKIKFRVIPCSAEFRITEFRGNGIPRIGIPWIFSDGIKFRITEFRGILQNSVTNCDGIPGEICDGIPLDTLNLPLRNEFESIFDLDEDRIILEADKKVGYVCLLKTDIYLQYDKIIKEQHFGATSINESWYINNIKGFIEEARSALPPQLSNIIKPKDFDWEFTNAEIGVLRLQPKV